MNEHHLELLKKGAEEWNKFQLTKGESADLSNAILDNIHLYKANLENADFQGASFMNTTMNSVNFSGANFENAFCPESYFGGCNFENANLKGTKLFRSKLDASNLKGAVVDENTDMSMCNLAAVDMSGIQAKGISMSFSLLSSANLTDADFSNADLSQVVLVGANIDGTNFTGAKIHGISAWDLQGQARDESNLIITKMGDSILTVDDLEVAQFVYLILNNQKIRDVINTVTTKTVLILGRFSEERKKILDAIRNQLHKQNYVGVIFDFDPSEHRNLTETVSTLAHMAKFIIADVTHARSIGQELTHIIPQLPSVPVQPIVHSSDTEWAMFKDLKVTGTVLPTFTYDSLENLLDSLEQEVINPINNWFLNHETDELERLQKRMREKEKELKEQTAEILRLRELLADSKKS